MSCFVLMGEMAEGLVDSIIHIYGVPPISGTESCVSGRELWINDGLCLEDPIKPGGDRNQNRTFQ